jgi:hypothetical protein
MLKVLWPMEPVEPRMAIFFTPFILLVREGIYLGMGVGGWQRWPGLPQRLKPMGWSEIYGTAEAVPLRGLGGPSAKEAVPLRGRGGPAAKEGGDAWMLLSRAGCEWTVTADGDGLSENWRVSEVNATRDPS